VTLAKPVSLQLAHHLAGRLDQEAVALLANGVLLVRLTGRGEVVHQGVDDVVLARLLEVGHDDVARIVLGIGTGLAHLLSPLAGNIIGLVVLSAICGLPFLSPVLGPGAVIAQVIGAAIIGPAIGNGTIPPQMALPALFAYDTQVGCDFVPVGMALGEAKPETIRIGVPAVLLSRQIMGPISVLIAWAASFAL